MSKTSRNVMTCAVRGGNLPDRRESLMRAVARGPQIGGVGASMFFKRNRATSNDNGPVSRGLPSHIAPDMVVEGSVSSRGELHIEGTVRGAVDAEICIVGREGVVEGSIRATELIVRGRVMGPVHAGHVELHDGAQVEGDIVNGSIAMQAGAQLQGAVWHSDNPLGDSGGGAISQPSRSSSFLASPLWSGDDDGFRPLKVVKPR
jgi:cytoskeletal protein CcmA (bactofilin family)